MPDFGSDINITGSGKITFSGNAGTTRQILSSRGSSSQPAWQDDEAFICLGFSNALADPVAANNVAQAYRQKFPATITSINLDVATAVSGSTFIIDLLVNGVSIFSTRPQIAVGSTAMTNTPILSSATMPLDSLLAVNIIQAGGGGRQGTVTIGVKRTGS